MGFDFLKTIKLQDTKQVVSRKVTKTPEGMALRVYANGRVFPAAKLTETFNLEYGEDTFGLDYLEAHAWGAYPKDQPNVLFISPINRKEPKIDLFGTRRTPDTSVLTQGPLDKGLWDLVVKIFPEAKGHIYVDLMVHGDGVTTEDGIYYLPKTVSRGDRKGTVTTVRRENIALFPVTCELGPEVVVKETEITTIKN
jgi:hypothetical protein